MQIIHSAKIQCLIKHLNTKEEWDNEMLLELLEDMAIKEEDIAEYQLYGHSRRLSYGRNEIYSNKRFRIYLMSWDFGDSTAIHNHGSTDWGCVQFFGEAVHRCYEEQQGFLKLTNAVNIKAGEIVPVKGALIHLMSNANKKSICTLHIYGLNNPETIIDDRAIVYQPESGKQFTTSGSAYLDMDTSEILSTSVSPLMLQADYQDYMKIITPFYERIDKKEFLA